MAAQGFNTLEVEQFPCMATDIAYETEVVLRSLGVPSSRYSALFSLANANNQLLRGAVIPLCHLIWLFSTLMKDWNRTIFMTPQQAAMMKRLLRSALTDRISAAIATLPKT